MLWRLSGSAIVTGVGGREPYTYLWNTIPSQTGDTISNLAAGEYAVIYRTIMIVVLF